MKNILYTIILSFLFSSNVFADVEAARNACKKGDFETAFKITKSLAVQGDAKAQAEIGAMYYFGQCVKKDYVLAHMWFSIASDNGDRYAKYMLGYPITFDEGREETRSLSAEITEENFVEATKLKLKCIKSYYMDCGY